MSYTKTILCLANSRKPPSGRCIAGRETSGQNFGDWVRPVSSRETLEVSEQEREYQDGTDPSVLDIVTIQFKKHTPLRHQVENHLLDDGFYWRKVGSASWTSVLRAVEDPAGSLWANESSTYFGLNDRVSAANAILFTRSLYLVHPDQLDLIVREEGEQFGNPRRRVRARFTLCGEEYNMPVTDPVITRKCFAGKDGEYPVKESVICVSLADVYQDFAYKLVASVITPKRAGG